MSSSLPPELIASTAYILIHAVIDDYKRPRRFWRHTLFKERSGSALLLNLTSQTISGRYKNFTRLNPTDFEFFINLIGPRIQKSNTNFREAISVACENRSKIPRQYTRTIYFRTVRLSLFRNKQTLT
ncbi:hypothetical protein L798_08571 [Zootermopsis nevadensis]|uniref:Uncharacterized protein n=1 Tax=Zootermopsis nevadensis TaxID=136037 RepID=A0A067R5C4_ZOONE|nr:hypothetical protein L798_08571 [Zootermopsis nevadensis]